MYEHALAFVKAHPKGTVADFQQHMRIINELKLI